MSRLDVLALGELLIDFTCNGKSEQGNLLFEANPGGAPCNVLAMLTKLGKRTGFIGKVGNDQFGRILKATLDEVGIDSKYLLADAHVPTTLAFVHRLEDGDREFSFYRNPGADMMLGEEDINDAMFNTKIFHFGSLSMTHEGVRNATIKALKIARKKGCLISLDPNLREPLWKDPELAKTRILEAISYCDILKISDNEIRFITGIEDFDLGIKKLRDMYDVSLICLTMGRDGSRAYYKDMRVEVPGFEQSQIVDATGAGDTFCGSVLGYICDNGLEDLTELQLEEMLTNANAAASLVIQKKGAIKSMPEIDIIRKVVDGK
ncbi:MAG: carbohydrate kinase [Butyrivibrio sp.]|nr:carbohydrate kinase [Butyrivibrio sp.]